MSILVLRYWDKELCGIRSMTDGLAALVTGGAGFIGSHVIERLLTNLNFSTVVCVDDLSGGSLSSVPSGAIMEVGSVTNASFVTTLFERYRFDYIYHLAAYAAEGLSHFIRTFNYRTNLIATTLLINAAVRAETVKCFVFTSSIAVYGTGQGLRQVAMSEEGTHPVPEDPYGIAKRAAELDLQAAHKVWGMPYIIFRPHNVYGPRQARDRYRNVISIFLSQLASNQSLTVFGDGEQTRAFTYVDDVAAPIASAPFIPAAHNHTFNVGSDEVHSVNDLALALAAAWGQEASPTVTHLPARHEVTHAHASHSKLRDVLGGNLPPPTPLRTGIKATVSWAKRTGHWLPHGSRSPANSNLLFERPVRAVEVMRNLPPSWASEGIREVSEVISLERSDDAAAAHAATEEIGFARGEGYPKFEL
jgi:UDP-glucose 4-epimerase